VAVGQVQFGNPGRGTSAIGTQYQRTGVGQHTKRTQCVCSEQRSMRHIDRLCETVIAL
jgi:hypothetical protein